MAKRMKQENLPGKGMDGTNPNLDAAARELIEAMEEETRAAVVTEQRREALKLAIQDAHETRVKVDGHTFKLKPSLSLSHSGPRKGRGQED